MAGALQEEITTGKPDRTGDEGSPSTGVYGWDWSATTHAALDGPRSSQRLGTDPAGFVPEMLRALGAARVAPGRGLQGWSRSWQAFDQDGYALGSVYFGGGRSDVHVLSTSAAADSARRSVLDFDSEARTARVDTRVDTLKPFEELTALCEDAASVYGSVITEMHSRQRGESLGRTLYLGAPSSAVRVRVYEKWLESPGQYVEGTNRVEVQLRPPSRVKGRVSGWTPAETFCASKTTRALAALLETEVAPASSLHVARGVPDLERTLQVMGEQYGPAVERWLAHSDGDLDRVMHHLTVVATGSRLGVVDVAAGAAAVAPVVLTPTRGREADDVFPSVVEPVRGGPYAPALYGPDGAPF